MLGILGGFLGLYLNTKEGQGFWARKMFLLQKLFLLICHGQTTPVIAIATSLTTYTPLVKGVQIHLITPRFLLHPYSNFLNYLELDITLH